MNEIVVTEQEVLATYEEFKKNAEASGYYLNPDVEFTKELIRGLIYNKKRYGYFSCPCRIALGVRSLDLDIICPCDYRDDDLKDYGFCYCGLYVTKEVIDQNKKVHSIPDRRGFANKLTVSQNASQEKVLKLSLPVWRCRVCGYLCARIAPPELCPICKADKDRFEKFI
ncbi:MAG: ferredoxin:glutaredoxin reductase [candidate division WOR-3 bacterium]|nr:ferredoxin:glutaredoxin reductase [candidate division WOR-3 bacterium]MCX7757015.1 ferredoxin:glutaredoxin reductase [candidate division WOR-3 bacterium]MDW7987319.1 ferredoxin-thioredoxin reductase catalytic domain-containing protein [candidate division WOR-3 bacterium]